MVNMDYCKFQNTAEDLEHCVDEWANDEDLSEDEKDGKHRIIELARQLLDYEDYKVEEK